MRFYLLKRVGVMLTPFLGSPTSDFTLWVFSALRSRSDCSFTPSKLPHPRASQALNLPRINHPWGREKNHGTHGTLGIPVTMVFLAKGPKDTKGDRENRPLRPSRTSPKLGEGAEGGRGMSKLLSTL